MSYSKSRTLILVVMALLLVSSVVTAQEGKVLKITTHELCYANIFVPLEIPKEAYELTLEYKIKGDNIAGYSWGGGVFLYWSEKSFAGLRIDTSELGKMRADIGTVRQNEVLEELVEPNAWLDVKLEVGFEKIDFYTRNTGDEEWILVASSSRPLTLMYPAVGIVIGQGYTVGEPYLRYSNSDPRKLRALYFDDIVLKAGDKVIYSEDFEKTTIADMKANYDVASDSRNEEPVFEIVAYEE